MRCPCGKDISGYPCAFCGRKSAGASTAKGAAKGGCLGCGGLLFAFVALVYVLADSTGSADSGPSDEVVVSVLCENAVERQLRSPSTADFPFGMVTEVRVTGDAAVLASYVDAQNAFGAEIRTRFLCEAERSEGEWRASVTMLP